MHGITASQKEFLQVLGLRAEDYRTDSGLVRIGFMSVKSFLHGNKTDIHPGFAAFIHNTAKFRVEDDNCSIQDFRAFPGIERAAVRSQQARITRDKDAGLGPRTGGNV